MDDNTSVSVIEVDYGAMLKGLNIAHILGVSGSMCCNTVSSHCSLVVDLYYIVFMPS